MATNRPLAPGESVLSDARRKGRPEPHWAIAILLDYRIWLPDLWEELLKEWELRPTGWEKSAKAENLYLANSWIRGDVEKAMGCFVEETPGWVPWWFPRKMTLHQGAEQEKMIDLSADQRLAWFDKALAHCAPGGWPPQEPLRNMKIETGVSLLRMLRQVDEYELPGIDRM